MSHRKEVKNVADKKIDYSKYSQEQLAVARMMANPDIGMTNREMADAATGAGYA